MCLVIDCSVVMGWLGKSDGVICIYDEVRGVDVVAFQDHLEHFWLMNGTFFHEVDDLILDDNSMVDIVIKLYLNFILELTSFVEELLVVYWISKVLAVFSDQVEFTNVGPTVESVSHWVHGPDSYVLSSSE